MNFTKELKRYTRTGKCAICSHLLNKRNPVKFADSVDAFDLIGECLRLLRLKKEASPDFLDRLREQLQRHKRSLRPIIGSESL